jgi:hypothetical protein
MDVKNNCEIATLWPSLSSGFHGINMYHEAFGSSHFQDLSMGTIQPRIYAIGAAFSWHLSRVT